MGLFNKGKETSNRLINLLEECKKESSRSYEYAQNIIDDLYTLLSNSQHIIKKGCQEIENFSSTDVSIAAIGKSLKNQLKAIGTELKQDIEATRSDLQIKFQHDTSFNITLFGRTMVGKSTLMSILTHANEEAIGKGGQRTTRDVREYEWKGMKVTDVPGIDAFDGKEDDKIAEAAAKNADLIIFMISSGQPESSEADWLIKLKREDKAIICLCNFKSGFGNPAILKAKLKNKASFIEGMRLNELKIQFNDFLRTELPHEHIDIYVSMLLAEQLAHRPEYENVKEDLLEISKFSDFKRALIAQISSRGIFYRRKSYLALIDVPVYKHYLNLLQFANDTYSSWNNIHQKQIEFKGWQREFNSTELESLKTRIEGIFGEVQRSILGFVEAHVESKAVDSLWRTHLNSYNIEEKIKKAVETSLNRCQNKIEEIFTDLGNDLQMTAKISNKYNLASNGGLTNWKRIWGWSAALSGVGATIAFIVLGSNPIGWAITGIGLLFGVFEWFSNSRESKLREARQQMYDSLTKSLEEYKYNALNKVEKIFQIQACDRMQKTAFNRLCMIQSTILTVLNVERRCAMEYSRLHTIISKQLVDIILCMDIRNMGQHIRIEKVARIPGKRIIIVSQSFIDDQAKRFISGWMGCNERVESIKLRTDLPSTSQLSYLGKIYLPDISLKLQRLKNGEEVIYAPKISYDQAQLDGMDIIQQLLNKPIIRTNV